MRILIVTDAWEPQVNGVVRTLKAIRCELERMGHGVSLISPDGFRSLPCPSYPEVRLALGARRKVDGLIRGAEPDAIHIATEGPLGLAARSWCLKHGRPFTTAYHTHFPDYVAQRTRLPADCFWRYIRWFHRPARGVLVSTPTLARQLHERGISQTRPWGRGVDLSLFRTGAPPHPDLFKLARPIQLYVGRVAVEKNIDAFLETRHRGSKVVVGTGPAIHRLKQKYPAVSFLGALHGEALASAYSAADVFVFPSRTDTFGLVMVEALACGTPVAAFPVAGPLDVLQDSVGAMSDDLGLAIDQASRLDRAACSEYGRTFSWERSARQFLDALAPIATPLAA